VSLLPADDTAILTLALLLYCTTAPHSDAPKHSRLASANKDFSGTNNTNIRVSPDTVRATTCTDEFHNTLVATRGAALVAGQTANG
jgi:hypothetical protein